MTLNKKALPAYAVLALAFVAVGYMAMTVPNTATATDQEWATCGVT